MFVDTTLLMETSEQPLKIQPYIPDASAPLLTTLYLCSGFPWDLVQHTLLMRVHFVFEM